MTVEYVLLFLIVWYYLRFHAPILITYQLVHPKAKKPTKVYHKAACFDVYAAEETVVYSDKWKEIDIGVAFAPWPHIYIPFLNLTLTPFGNVAGRIHTRSGMARRKGLRAHLGVIDNDYRAPWSIVLFNQGLSYPVHIREGDKIAQIEFYRVPSVWMIKVKRLSKSLRGKKGFGSTDK